MLLLADVSYCRSYHEGSQLDSVIFQLFDGKAEINIIRFCHFEIPILVIPVRRLGLDLKDLQCDNYLEKWCNGPSSFMAAFA